MLGFLALYKFDPYGIETLISTVVGSLWYAFVLLESNLGRCVTLKFGLF